MTLYAQSIVQYRSGQILDLLLVSCNPVQPVAWTGRRRLNRLPHWLSSEEGGLTSSRIKNKTCQRVEELSESQQPSSDVLSDKDVNRRSRLLTLTVFLKVDDKNPGVFFVRVGDCHPIQQSGLSYACNPPFKAVLKENLVRNFEFIMKNIESDNPAQVYDARPIGRFTGDEPEPRRDLPSGRMPKSKSLPYGKCLDLNKKCFKEPDELKKLFAEAGVDFSKPLVTSCGSGVTGSGLLLAAYLAGITDVALYDGSWTEYVQRVNPDMILKGQA